MSDSEDEAIGEEAGVTGDDGEAAGAPANHLHAAGTARDRQNGEDKCILYVSQVKGGSDESNSTTRLLIVGTAATAAAMDAFGG